MLVKFVILFLAAMALVGFVGKLLFPASFRRITTIRPALGKPSRCRRCGRYLLGKGGCDCGKG
ncbi:hypothetical protein GU927_008315 [Rhodobacteraceae bacterium HSP-20]|uniref:Short-chain dehydrogenase n=1 Tax=Paragemmobacter amnigenus TaxID=2852097 RepID=A0ABS6J269_9RHOB|nr:hypothetical protein [Rhodobacter amnigenus]MBU9697851.1 hypothetical protein [Rhodobacter amnigenus]MBV4389078.1 hypothetical protein [Rhodobacter amnigenus]